MDFARFLRILQRWGWLLIGGAVLAAIGGWSVSQVIPPTYESRAVVLVGSALSAANADTGQMEASRRLAETYEQVAATRPLLLRVLDTTEATGTVEELREHIDVTTLPEPSIVEVTVTWGEASVAADIANAVVTELVALSPSREGPPGGTREFIERQVAAVEREIDGVVTDIDRLARLTVPSAAQEARMGELRVRLTELQTTYAALLAASGRTASNQLSVLEEAVAAAEPSTPIPLQNAFLGGIAGLMLSFLFAFLLERSDNRVRSAVEIERATGLPTIGAVARLPGSSSAKSQAPLVDAVRQRGAASAFRALRTNLDLVGGKPVHTLLVTSAEADEGRSVVAGSLAVAFVRAGRNVILVDADLQHPTLHQFFGIDNLQGIGDHLRSPSPAIGGLIQQTEIVGLGLLTTGQGPSTSVELLGSPRMKSALQALRKLTDLVIIGGPPLLSAPETSVLAASVDGVLLIVDYGHTRRPSLEAARDSLLAAGARVKGAVLYGVRPSGADHHTDLRPPGVERSPDLSRSREGLSGS